MTFYQRVKMLSLGSCIALVMGCGGGPHTDFASQKSPAAPDYTRADAWLAFPGRNGLERSTPAGLTPVAEAAASADLFYIHPTTSGAKDVWNVAWSVSDQDAPLNPAVLASQVSVFNGCCRLFAPRYRQATLPGLGEQGAMDLAYADIAAAFRNFLSARSHDRPFIIASHSQGTAHAIRLLQEEVIGRPQQSRLIAAYLIGGYVPVTFADAGLPVCETPLQTGCVISWNASKVGSLLARIVIHDKDYWWKGRTITEGQPSALCVNPLTWRAASADTTAHAQRNPGSMALPLGVTGATAVVLPALDVGLTGARCHDGMLEVDLASNAGRSYSDRLTRFAGSYHLNDYGLFYAALRANAIDRVAAWRLAG